MYQGKAPLDRPVNSQYCSTLHPFKTQTILTSTVEIVAEAHFPGAHRLRPMQVKQERSGDRAHKAWIVGTITFELRANG